MNKPKPEDYIVQRACLWRETEKVFIASNGPEREVARSAHEDAKRKLREAVDIVSKRKP